MFLDVLDEMLTNERSSLKDIEERFVATVACKVCCKSWNGFKQTRSRKLNKQFVGIKKSIYMPTR